MMKILPILIILIGTGTGIGGGMMLRPSLSVEAEPQTADAEEPHEEQVSSGIEYVKLNNQFVVPVVQDGQIASLIVMSLSIETIEGQTNAIYSKEPKLRDSFLQVLFDHANIGGFNGAFTDADVLGVLRNSLREAAKKILSQDVVRDVLILEIARQDY